MAKARLAFLCLRPLLRELGCVGEMEVYHSLAVSNLETAQEFSPPEPGYQYDCLEVTAEDGKDGELFRVSRPEPELASWIQSRRQGAGASLKLVSVDRVRNWTNVSMRISKECFGRVFNAMGADPTVKYFIYRNYDGFYELHGEGYLLTRFIGTPEYALLWTFDPSSLTTRAVVMMRRVLTLDPFVDHLSVHRSRIYSSWLLGLVSCHLLLVWFDHQTEVNELGPMRLIEIRTGSGPPQELFARPKQLEFDIDTLTEWSQRVNEVAGNITNKIRHQKISRTVLDLISQECRASRPAEGIPDEMVERSKTSMKQLARVLPLLESQMSTYLDFLAYLHDRAERLSAVLFALLTHQDAAASIDLAAASKRDSSSMKTVAIVTMAFLPATFFAALFALPSLQWDETVAVQDGFWVYWAFTLPSTAAVFLIWIVITKRKTWIPAIRAKMFDKV